jgi:Reverse transcriptase (RNA-dependent DNA polymerase)
VVVLSTVLSAAALARDKGNVGAIMLLDMSAAFDTVDHSNVLDVPKRRFGIQDATLNWLSDFLTDRRQVIRSSANQSDNLN